MTGREKFIVVLMIAALVYGVVSLVGDARKRKARKAGNKPAAVQKALTSFADSTRAVLAASQPTPGESRVLDMASTEWPETPFVQEAHAAEEGPDSPEFVYSGLLDMGAGKVAIVNGTEYQAGDKLADEGYKLKRIESDRVEIERTRDSRIIVVRVVDPTRK